MSASFRENAKLEHVRSPDDLFTVFQGQRLLVLVFEEWVAFMLPTFDGCICGSIDVGLCL